MFYHYATLKNNNTVICHSENRGTDNQPRVLVHVETPAEEGGFKECELFIPDMTLKYNKGYSTFELTDIITFVKGSIELMIEFSKCGGASNA